MNKYKLTYGFRHKWMKSNRYSDFLEYDLGVSFYPYKTLLVNKVKEEGGWKPMKDKNKIIGNCYLFIIKLVVFHVWIGIKQVR